ncbi:MAG: hypothetical protein ABI625_09935 [bacterium]
MQSMSRGITTSACFALTMSLACAAPGPSSSPADLATDTAAARAEVVKLESDARALVKPGGCGAANLCRTAPVGAKGCGGPREYLVYCSATTDSVALFKKLDELKAAEMKYNQSVHAISTCEFRLPPGVVAEGGSCRAGP